MTSPKETRQTILLTWALTATVVAVACSGLAVFFFLQTRRPLAAQTPSASASPFLALPESAIPGRYKWISKSGNESFMTMNPDHTFTRDGGPNPAHRWEITRDALVIFWLRSQNRLNKIERPGVYVETQDGVELTRMEKQE